MSQKNNLIAYQDINKQADFVKKILKRNRLFLRLLNLLKDFGMPNWYVGGGSIGQIVWNYFHQQDLNFGINNFDVVYLDPDTSYEAEDIFIQKRGEVFEKFPMKPFSCVEEAISTFPTTSSAIRATLNSKEKLQIFAPCGFYDILTITMRANKVRVSREAFAKKAKDWSKKWPKLKGKKYYAPTNKINTDSNSLTKYSKNSIIRQIKL